MTTFLFDLDQTLVDSSALLGLRRMGFWTQVEANIGKVKPYTFPVPPHELPGRLKAMGHKIGIVTSAPRSYAEKLLATFQIPHDALVAYHDTTNHKPLPDPITAALAALGVGTDGACHVGDDPGDHEASYLAGVASLGAGWGTNDVKALSSCAPDALIMDPALLLAVDTLPQRGYYAESLFGGADPLPHCGSVLPCGDEVVALGRYFTTSDTRHAHSALTRNILVLKDDDAPAALFTEAIRRYLINSPWKPHYIVPVPPKPGQARNRFAAMLGTTFPAGATMMLDGLACTKTIDGYKSLGLVDRAAAVRDAYISKCSWNGARILLVDDVHTTGGTASACKRALLAQGASEVRTLVLAKDQTTIGRENCPQCGAPLRIRQSRYGPFWGCTAWRKNDPASCQYKRDA